MAGRKDLCTDLITVPTVLEQFRCHLLADPAADCLHYYASIQVAA